MTSVLLISQFALAVILTIVVLLQKSSSIGLGAYSGSNESVFGAKGPAGFLTKMTFFLGFLFVINTLTLGYFYNQERKASIIDGISVEQNVPSSPVAPIKGSAPQAPSSSSVPEASVPVAPVSPAVPQAPVVETNQSK